MNTEIFIKWSNFLNSIRKFLSNDGFIEVTTNHIVEAGAFEHSIDTIKVISSLGENELHTSPEMEMKVIMSEIKLPIYQICQCFRDDPPSPLHLLEFTMLEFYRPYKDYKTIMKDVENLINELTQKKLDFKKYSLEKLFQNIGISLADCDTKEKFRASISQKKLFRPLETDTWEDLFFKVMIDFIEPNLPQEPTFLYNYPAKLATLAKVKDEWSERFELYWNGMEICNGCTELTSHEELLKRIDIEKNARIASSKKPHKKPQRLIQSLINGLPECAGVAIGLNRLFSCLLGSSCLIYPPSGKL